MTASQEPKHIIWALNPFESDKGLNQQTIDAIAAFTSGGFFTIEPIYVLYPDSDYFVNPSAGLPWIRELKDRAKRLMESSLKDAQLKGLIEPKVLINSVGTLKTDVKTLVAYATSVHCELIVTTSHANTGFKRLILGSFAESLLMNSPIPILVINPHTHVHGQFKHMIYPTDFSEKSHIAFTKLIEMAKEHDAHVTILHQLPSSIEPYIAAGVNTLAGPYLPVAEYLAGDDAATEKKAQEWAEWAISQSVETDVAIVPKGTSVVETILKVCQQQNSDLIAMASQSGVLRATLLGSVTLEVVRNSACPIWVIHPEEPNEARKTGSAEKPLATGQSQVVV